MLTKAETKLARYCASHPEQTREEVAEALGLSPNTIRTHLCNIYSKLQVRNRAAMFKALKESPEI